MKHGFVIIGAGPAGLSAAYELSKQTSDVLVLEKDSVVGGLSRTVEYNGFRCDIGGHRFFTKIPYVEGLWHEVLGDDFLKRPRLSRIYYEGKFYYYPLRISNAFGNLGIWTSAAVMGSLLKSKLFPEKPEITFAQWVSNRFGRKLFELFFKAYTEKVWGISCDELSANWAAQRIKNLSLVTAILRAMGFGGKRSVASLIEEFNYPAYGPGQMYEMMGTKACERGTTIQLGSSVQRIAHADGRVRAVEILRSGQPELIDVDEACFSSMPLNELVLAMDPAPPEAVLTAARNLRYRSLVTVNLMLNQAETVPDTWIYIHDPNVRAARIQFYKNWSPKMVPSEDQSIIGLEYFCTEDDDLWNTPEDRLEKTAIDDLRILGLADVDNVFGAFCVRYAKAYPVYDDGYLERVETLREFLSTIKNLYPIGRYGQFRYNNMDHSILTAHYSVQAVNGEPIDPWSVNVEQEYHEEKAPAARG